ncbi:hypothetical protein [Halorubrum sp. 2020YC2]|uniref:hypothetical protein n=1 Tax=Halorubrum sp. 2020YC2 TaxID=2836432 RepID=UPI001BE6F0B5|nr:hypothetical protein [Halorubrum sp. 2020YC2]QWC18732.1 hypothetical protein KI388_11445 [Halorubrum sp. 2020YC2]
MADVPTRRRRLSQFPRLSTALARVSRLRGRTEDFIPARRRTPTMRFSRDRRGQSVVVGTVILFGFLILALASYQAFAVPAQNSEAEFDHNQDLQSDMQELRASLLDVGDAEDDPYQRPVSVDIGFRYEPRLFAVSPPPPTGNLRTEDRGPIDLTNARVSPDDASRFENTSLLFDPHETRLLTFVSGYNEYRSSPRTTFEHTLLYNRFERANQTVTGQRTVDGAERRLSLTTFSGDVDRRGFTTTLDPTSLDGPTPTVPIEPESDVESFQLRIPTHSPAVWTEIIGTETGVGEPNAAVNESLSSDRAVVVDLEGEWRLQMSRVGYDGGTVDRTPFSNVSRVDERSQAGNESSAFLTEWETDSITIPEGGSTSLNVTVTDRATGDPISNATINYSNARTAGSGRVRFRPTTDRTRDGAAEVSLDATDAVENDSYLGYATAGDDADVLSVNIGPPESTQALEPVAVDTSNSVLNFQMRNDGEETVTIEEFAVDTTRIQSGNFIESSSSDDELEITGSTTDGLARTQGQQVFNADGTRYSLEATGPGGQGQNAEIAAGDTVTVDIRNFEQRLDDGTTLEFTNDPGDADVIVTFVLSDGTEENLYLRRP